MPYPSLGTERARPDIAETFLEMDLAMNMQKLVATEVLPIRQVQYAHGTYPAVALKELMGAPVGRAGIASGQAFRREPRSGYFRDELSFVERTYATVEHGLEGVVDENEAAHYASMLEHEAVTAQWVRHRLLVEQEKRVAADLFNTTTFAGQTSNLAQAWATYNTADPIANVLTARLDVLATYGVWPDAIIMNEISYSHLIRTDQIRDRITASGAGTDARVRNITRQAVAEALDLDVVIVAGAVYDSANANAAFAGTHIWPTGALVFKRAMTNQIREICLGHTLHWAADASMPNGFVEDYRDAQVRGNIIRVRHQVQELRKYNVGYFLQNTY